MEIRKVLIELDEHHFDIFYHWLKSVRIADVDTHTVVSVYKAYLACHESYEEINE